MSDQIHSIAMIGGRGFAGEELSGLLHGHPDIRLATIGTRDIETLGSLATHDVDFRTIQPADMPGLAEDHSIVVLATPNEVSPDYVAEAPDDLPILDLGASYRGAWHYGLPEVQDEAPDNLLRVANPGCYATAAVLALAPFKDLLDPTSDVVLVAHSGYSGGGSAYRDPEGPSRVRLHKTGVLGYSIGKMHVHVPEIADNLGIDPENIKFYPHIVDQPRGISMTMRAKLRGQLSEDNLNAMLHAFYEAKSLVDTNQPDIDNISEVANINGCKIGGVSASQTRTGTEVTITAGLDNLRKGAAVQALQNINLMLGKPELSGIT